MTADEKYTQMTQAPVEKLICKLAVPTICSMLITSLYNMADTFFVSKINPSATGAVGVVFSLMAIIQAVGFFFGQGSGSYVSRQLGIHNTQEAEKMVSFGFFTSFFSGFLIMIPGLIFIKQLAIVLGSTPTILPYSIDYLGIILLATPYMTSSLVLNNQLRFQGNAFYAMIGLCSGGILNIVLDPIFIFIFNMGIKGAALATALSQFVSFCLLIIGTFKSESINIRISKYPLKLFYFGEVCAGGFPSLSRQGIASVATICLNILAGRYGDVAVAAMSIVSRVAMFANSAMIGFGQGFQPVCGFCYGAGLYKRVIKSYKFCVKFSFFFLLVVSILGIIFAPEIIMLFSKGEKEVLEIGTMALRCQCIAFPLNSIIIISNMLLQVIRKPVKATILSVCRQGLILIPVLLITTHILGLLGLEIAQPISDITSSVVSVVLVASVLNEFKQKDRELQN